ncbi:MAG TPA: hypothetical protein VJ772_04290 [Nitrososphaeraceae archaeon]|nr:hypothetical protein [Nitrososphaeraceae archaeon]
MKKKIATYVNTQGKITFLMTSKITDIVYGAPAIGMKKNEYLLRFLTFDC